MSSNKAQTPFRIATNLAVRSQLLESGLSREAFVNRFPSFVRGHIEKTLDLAEKQAEAFELVL